MNITPQLYIKEFEFKDGMCVYGIECIPNGKFYVGITSGYLRHRIQSHFRDLRSCKHRNPYLQFAYNKYGEANFKIHLLYNDADTVEKLAELESFFCELLQVHNPDFGYNCKVPGFIKNRSKANFKYNNPVVRYPEERRKQYSERMKKDPSKWIKPSPEGIKNMAEKAKERNKTNPCINNLKNTTDEAKERGRLKRIGVFSGSKNPASKHVIAYDIYTGRQYSFPTRIEAANALYIHKCTIDRKIAQNKVSSSGLMFMKP